jgi:ABC-type polysaccharide/polyol phosphate export permease
LLALSAQQLARATRDLHVGILSVHVWPTLAWQEIRQRYRRSVLGPFWLTISIGVMIAGMGPLYSRLFGQDTASYFPHLAVSFIVWLLLASLINEACTCFMSAEGLIKEGRMPLTVHVLRVIWKNLIIFAHHSLILVILFMFYPPPLGWGLLLVPLAIFAIAVNALWAGLFLGMLCARFRDIPLIIQSIVQVMFFLTPVLWTPGALGRHAWAAQWNPLNHLLEIVRAPLLDGRVPLLSWAAVLGMALVGFAFVVPVFARFRARIAYWV